MAADAAGGELAILELALAQACWRSGDRAAALEHGRKAAGQASDDAHDRAVVAAAAAWLAAPR
jgi:hypothetical protein